MKKILLLTLPPHVRENVHSTEFVLASVRPGLWKGASRVNDCEAIGGEVGRNNPGVGRVRTMTFLTILRDFQLVSILRWGWVSKNESVGH